MYNAHPLGASSSEVVQTTRTIHCPDGHVIVTCTKIAFVFHHPCAESPYRPPHGSTLDDTTRALLRGEWPFDYSPPHSPANCIHHLSPISISTSSSRSSSPPAYVNDRDPLDLQAITIANQLNYDEATPEARRCRRAQRRAIPPADRWYTVTRGRCVGVVQGV